MQGRLAAALFGLPLLLGLAAPVAAQTIDSTEITEGETKTFTVSGIPSSWTGSTVTVQVANVTAFYASCDFAYLEPNWDVCDNLSAESYNQDTRIYTFELQARADSVNDPNETFIITLNDPDDSLRHVTFTITIREPLSVGPEHMPQIVLSQDYFQVDEPQADNCSDDKVGDEKTYEEYQDTDDQGLHTRIRVNRNYGPKLTSVGYTVSLDRSPGPGKIVSVEIWEPTDLDSSAIDPFVQNARIHGIGWPPVRQGRISIENSPVLNQGQPVGDKRYLNTYLTFTDKNWDQPKKVTVNVHCAQHDVTTPLPIWHFAFRHDTSVYSSHHFNRKGDNSSANTSLKIAEVRVADSTEPDPITGNVDGNLVLDPDASGYFVLSDDDEDEDGYEHIIGLDFHWNNPDNSLHNDYDDASGKFAGFRVSFRTVDPPGHAVQEEFVRADFIIPGEAPTTASWRAELEANGYDYRKRFEPNRPDRKYEWSVVPVDRHWNDVEAERVTRCVLMTGNTLDLTANPTCPAALQGESEGASTAEVPVPDTAVANVRATAVDDASASVSWDAVEHATAYEVSWSAESSDAQTVLSGVESVTGTSATIRHNAQVAMTLTVTVTPEYIDDNGLTQPLKDLAGTATLEVGPQPLGGGGTNGGGDGSGVDAGEGDARASAIAACVSADLMQHVEARIEIAITDRWVRIRNALIGQPNAITLAEVKEIYENRKANGWDTNRLEEVIAAMECIESAMQQSPVPDATPDAVPDSGPDPESTPTPDPDPAPEPVACVSPQLRADAKSYSEETWRESPDHVERWLRVLQTFSGTANDSTVMTPAEAEEYVNRGWERWEPVLEALKCMEQQALDSS